MALPPREVGKVSSVGNFTSSGVIGAASIDTDVRVILIAQTTSGLVLTLPNPSDTNVVVGVDVVNTGSASFKMHGAVLLPSTMVRYVWVGSIWVPPTDATMLGGRTPVADASYTALATDRTIAFTSLTAARTVTLPAASAFPASVQMLVVDESGACSATNTITLARAGSDTIDGAASVVVALANGYIAVESDGSSKWTVVDQSAASMAQQAASAVAITGGTIDGTAIGGTTPAAGGFTSLLFPSTAGSAGAVNKITLYSSFGFGISAGSLDYVSNGNHTFYMAATRVALLTNTGLNATAVGATTPSTVRGTTIAATTSVNFPSYTVGTLPAAGTAGRNVHCSNARMQTATAGTLEASGSGTGGLVTDNGTAWKIAGTNITVSA